MLRTAVEAHGRTNRFLVCEDDRAIARLIQLRLKRQGQSVVCVYDGRAAVELLGSPEYVEGHARFDRIVLDLMMPELDGLEVLKWIRLQAHTRHLWVGLMIAKQEDRELFEQVPYRPDACFLKPFNPADLLR